MDSDGFLGESDLEHWYSVNRVLLDTGGFEAVSLEQVRICNANPKPDPNIRFILSLTLSDAVRVPTPTISAC